MNQIESWEFVKDDGSQRVGKFLLMTKIDNLCKDTAKLRLLSAAPAPALPVSFRVRAVQ